jgi:thioredoxin-dependent peroxiredoxin
MTVGVAHKPYGVWRWSKTFGKKFVGGVRCTPEDLARKNWPKAAKAAGHAEAVLAALTQLSGG